MSIFVHSDFLLLGLLLFISLILIYFFSERTRRYRLSLLTSEKLLDNLVPGWSPVHQKINLILFLLSLFFIIVALARPQWGSQKRETSPTGIDILVAVDVSKSMLARDVKPNRLERVKLSISNLLGKVRGDRLGLIAFSGSSFLQCPLTLDHQAFLKTLYDLEIGVIKRPGTNLALPIDEASRSFSKDDSDRFLILLSDGEDLEGQGLKRAKKAAQEGIKIYTIGIGSEDGAKIPTDPLGNPARNFLLDREGKTIFSKMDDQSLKAIAEATKGKYFPLGPTGEGLDYTLQHLQSIGQLKKKTQLSSELPIERFQPFVLLAFFFLLLETISKSGSTKKIRVLKTALPFLILLLGGCLKKDNVKNAELEIERKNFFNAAIFYEKEINATQIQGKPTDPKLFLNAGLSYLQSGKLDKAEKFLEEALDLSIDNPNLQSIALNALGNCIYQKTNLWLDQQNVSKARESWKLALAHYKDAFQLDGNKKAADNLASLQKQIDQRIQTLVSTMTGRIWRDINGDGKLQKSEPFLRGCVFWDKDGNGEHNQSNEPKIDTDENGVFSFEWISSDYPNSIQIGSFLVEENKTQEVKLLPLFPAPPPPLNPNQVRNHVIIIDKPGIKQLPVPYRAAPVLQGSIWSDQNGNGTLENPEGPYVSGNLFLDQNGNFQLDENETSFKPRKDGTFSQIVPPGQYSLCLELENKDANVTFPFEEKKAYLTWVDFEAPSEELNFGVQDNSNQESESETSNQANDYDSSNDSNPDQKKEENDSKATVERDAPQEVNGLYERLLQEMESRSEPLEQDLQLFDSGNSGRDY